MGQITFEWGMFNSELLNDQRVSVQYAIKTAISGNDDVDVPNMQHDILE